MKKKISLVLIVAILWTCTVSAFATQSTILVEQREDGTYQVTRKKSAKAITATQTEDEEIYETDENIYLIQTEANTFLPAEKVMIDNEKTESQTEKILDEHNVPEEVIASITENMQIQKERGNEDAAVELFVPLTV